MTDPELTPVVALCPGCGAPNLLLELIGTFSQGDVVPDDQRLDYEAAVEDGDRPCIACEKPLRGAALQIGAF